MAKKAAKKAAKKVGKKAAKPAVKTAFSTGAKMPAFKLTLDTGEAISDADLKGKPTVIFVYPRANTPGCTQEACEFGSDYATFAKAGVRVYGMSRDSAKANANFRTKFAFPYPLICDPAETTLKKWGLLREKNMYGKKVMGVVRTTLLLDSDLTIRQVWDAVKVNGHVAEVLKAATGK
jgi:peroxiredoxin Q/BCP